MSPEHDRRQTRPETSETTGWHSLEFIVRQALEVQRDVGTASAEEFLQDIGVNQQVISRVLAPQAKLRAADEEALSGITPVADLPVASRLAALRNRLK